MAQRGVDRGGHTGQRGVQVAVRGGRVKPLQVRRPDLLVKRRRSVSSIDWIVDHRSNGPLDGRFGGWRRKACYSGGAWSVTLHFS